MKIWNSIFGSFKKKKKVEAPRGGGIDAALERAMREMRKERGEKEIEWEVRFTKTLQLGRLYSIVILFGFPGERDGFDPGLKGFVQANRNRAVTIEPLHPGVEPDPLADAEEVFRATVHYEAVQVAAGILAVPQVAAEGSLPGFWRLPHPRAGEARGVGGVRDSGAPAMEGAGAVGLRVLDNGGRDGRFRLGVRGGAGRD